MLFRSPQSDLDVSITDAKEKVEKVASLDQMLKQSETFRSIQILLGQYIQLEQFFMAQSIQKAVEMDNLIQATGAETYVLSSVTDDVFFIVKKCVKRSLTSQSVDGVCAIINIACGILESDFAELLLNQLRQG